MEEIEVTFHNQEPEIQTNNMLEFPTWCLVCTLLTLLKIVFLARDTLWNFTLHPRLEESFRLVYVSRGL